MHTLHMYLCEVLMLYAYDIYSLIFELDVSVNCVNKDRWLIQYINKKILFILYF